MFLGGNVWLKNWSEANSETGSNSHVGKYIGIYFAFGIGSAALSVVQTMILWIFCSIEVGWTLSVIISIRRADMIARRRENYTRKWLWPSSGHQ